MQTLILSTTLVLSLLALPACGTLQSSRSGSNPVTKPPTKPPGTTLQSPAKIRAENEPVAQPANPVTQALRKDASAALGMGDLTGATRLLERALRIDARDADTYLLFARLRNTQGDSRAALQLIDKGLSLRPTDKTANALRKLRQSIDGAVLDS